MKKIYLILIFMISSFVSHAQSDKLAKLDEKNGFRNIKFLTPLNSMSDMVYLSEDDNYQKIYKKRNENLMIGDIKVEQILYKFLGNKLYEVEIIDQESMEFLDNKFLSMLTELYGRSTDFDRIDGNSWRGKKVYLKLKSASSYNGTTKIIYTSSEWYNAYQLESSRRANKYKNDL